MTEVSLFFEILIKGAIGIAVPIVVVFAVQLISQFVGKLRIKLGETRFSILQAGVAFAVQAAEQAGLAKLILNEGKVKKEYAVEAVQNFLKVRGFTINVGTIEAAIEVAIAKGLQTAPKG